MIIPVENNLDEYAAFETWLKLHAIQDAKVVLMLTTRCNLQCSYCYQIGTTRDSHPDMQSDILSATTAWVDTLADRLHVPAVRVFFYGGEPTLRPDLVRGFAKRFAELHDANGKNFHFSIYTNAAIPHMDIIRLIRETCIEHLQITLDGLRETHDSRRKSKSGKGSFNVVWENLHRVLQETDATVLIDVNFDAENESKVTPLLDALAHQEHSSDRLSVAFNPVFLTEHTCGRVRKQALPVEQTAAIWANLYKMAIQYGLKCNPLRFFDTGPCSFWRAGHLVISPTGEIYKCIGMPGRDQCLIGNVVDGFTDDQKGKLHQLISLRPWENEKCLACAWLPLCLGGCRFHSVVEAKDIRKPYCRSELFEIYETEMLRYLALSDRLENLTEWKRAEEI